MMSVQSTLRGIDQPAMAFAETADTIGLMCWLFEKEMLAKINEGYDVVSDILT